MPTGLIFFPKAIRTKKEFLKFLLLFGLLHNIILCRSYMHDKKNHKLLIKGGYILSMDTAIGDIPVGDVLIEGQVITQIAKHIAVDEKDGTIIDASGMVVMPGLIDNHRHMWQGLIPGVSSNHTFGEYFGYALDTLSPKFTPDDASLGDELAAYEAMNAGVTTLLDWSHIAYTPDHAIGAIEGLKRSGIRAVYAYGPPARSKEWFDSNAQPSPEDVRHVLQNNLGGHVTGALAIRGPEFSTMERVKADITLARELGVHVTMHAGIPGFHEKTPSAKLINDAGLMGSDLTFVHCNAMTVEDFKLIAKGNAHVSCSPEVEMQMGLGRSPLDLMLEGGVKPTVSVDVVTAIDGHLLLQLRFLLQRQREEDQRKAFVESGKPLPTLPLKDRDVLPYVTTYPALSLGMQDAIGSLAPQKQADIILVALQDPNTFLREPSVALVQSVHPGNIDTVIIAGKIVKQHRQLLQQERIKKLYKEAEKANHRLLGVA
jgi:cytosine/adenosine deaminase-related metal-dependent hydrolase